MAQKSQNTTMVLAAIDKKHLTINSHHNVPVKSPPPEIGSQDRDYRKNYRYLKTLAC